MDGPEFLFARVHHASLALTRILFGFLMVLDITEERGGAEIDLRWGDPTYCNFPLFDFLPRPSYPWMCILYGVMWFGALGICIGYRFRQACAAYLLSYWYVLLLEKTFWNNHSYLYGLIGLILSVSSAGENWSLDAWISRKNTQEANKDGVPFWNYFLLRFQIFILYFFAGLKKLDMEWLDGYSMANLGQHWIFNPFALILTTDQIDYLVIHIAGFLLDLTVGFFLLWNKSRPLALFSCGMFHLINSRLFYIGMFPYVCLATMPIFCAPDWPVNLLKSLKTTVNKPREDHVEDLSALARKDAEIAEKQQPTTRNRTKSQKLTVFSIIIYCLIQLFLPWSHGITKGYNNWTNGMYGYSWDMMVHSWDTTLVIVKMVDNNNGKEFFLNPSVWVPNDRWNKHADMTVQYAKCVQRNFINEPRQRKFNGEEVSLNISLYVDVWCSLNGRFQQRMFNPHYDLLTANWSPFSDVEWLLPLLIEYSNFREKMKVIQEHVHSWSNRSDVLFVADFPDLYLEHFISDELTNITLEIIEGIVIYESEDQPKQSVLLKQGDSMAITSNVFHKIKTVSKTPSCFMYTFVNSTMTDVQAPAQDIATDKVDADVEELYMWMKDKNMPIPFTVQCLVYYEDLKSLFKFVGNALLHILYDAPIVRRAIVA